MEIDQIFGIPAHPLIVHLPVVFTPLIVIAAIALVVRRDWLSRFGIPLVIACVVLSFLCILATQSGESLQERVRETSLVQSHADLGEQMRNIVFLFTAFVIALVGYDILQRRGRTLPAVGATILAALVVISGIGATVWDVRTGHEGAKSVWSATGTGKLVPAGSGSESGGESE